MSQSQEFYRSSSPLPMEAYRYTSKSPSTIQLSIKELLTYVPLDWIKEGYSNQPATVELLCAEILQSHIPRISVDQLKKVVPHMLRIPVEVDPTTKVLLPTTRVALAYQLVTEKKEVTSKAPHCSSPKFSHSPDGQSLPDGQLSPDGAPSILPSPRRFFRALLWIQKKIGWRRADQAKKESDSGFFVPSSFSGEESQESDGSHASDDQNSEDPVSSDDGMKSTFLTSLPSFIPKPIPSSSQSVPVSAITTPSPLPTGNTNSSDSAYPSTVGVPLENSDTTNQQSAVLDKKHLITPLSEPSEFLSNENRLQTLLHTDERLSIHRVLDLCSQLPGIRDCILAQGWEVVARSQQMGSLDPMKAGSQASALIDSIREVSTKMGLDTVKAITLYSSDGPISFLHDQDLCFLIQHSDQERGFVPGVREKLQLILAELNKSRILVPPQALSSKTESIARAAEHDNF